MSEEKKTTPIAVFNLDFKDIKGSVCAAVEKAKREVEESLRREGFLIDADNTLFIHAPTYSHEIKRIVFNGTEIPLEGVTHVDFSVRPCERCELTVTRSPVPGAK